MTKILYLIILLPIFTFSQVQFKSIEFENGIRKHLNLTETAIISLNTLDTIQKIDLSGLNIGDVNDVTFLKRIKVLNLANNRIRDITPLFYLPRLKVLNIAGNNIENISTFTFSDKRSFKLIVSDNQISDFQNLQTATFSNVEVIGSDRQQVEPPSFLLNNLYTLTQENGQAIIKYNVWDSLNNCVPFEINYGNGTTNNNLQCDSYTSTQNYTYSTEGLKNIQITRENKTLTTHFVAPYNFTFDISQNYPIDLNLPIEINLVSLENSTAFGNVTIINNQIVYQPLAVGNDIIKVKYKYGTSNRTEVFYIFTTNTNTLSVEELALLKNIKVYPNPFQDFLTIQTKEEDLQNISLIDLQGKIIKQEKVSGSNYQLNLENLPQALYILEIVTDNSKQSVKIVKK